MTYWLGVILAISSGIVNNLGTLVQKKVVNDLPANAIEEKFFRSLIKHPLWLFGLILQFGIGTAFFMLAQVYIGPALIPGLMAAGLIVLAIGSVKLIGESLRLPEIIGTFMILIAIIAITLSALVIDVPAFNFLDIGFLIRISVFTSILSALLVIFYVLSHRWTGLRAICFAIISGFLFAMANYWISPLMATIVHVLAGTFVLPELVLFIVACLILIITNIFGLGTLQEAFKTGQASLTVPIQQVPVQIIPGLVYLFIFLIVPPTLFNLAWFALGVILILCGSYFLARRQALLETI